VLFRFSVDNLYEEKNYLISMNLTTSFEASGPVDSHVVVSKNYLLPKQTCQWKSDYFIKGLLFNFLHTNLRFTSLIWGGFNNRKSFYPFVFFYWCMVFNATFNNISVISWLLVLLVEETRVPGENH